MKRAGIVQRWRIPCLVVLSGLLAPSVAHAASVRQQERTARTACLSGEYEKGVSILSELFVDTRDPTYIYNQARCFEQNRRYEDAIGRFQEYLRAAPDLSAEDKVAAEKHIADCQELLAKQSGRAPAATPAPAPAPVSTAPAEPAVTPPRTREAEPSPPMGGLEAAVPQPGSTASGRGLRIAGIATASVGVAALISGVVLNLKVNGMADDLETLGGYSDGKESDRKTYATLGWIGYGAGAACVATGAVLYYLGARSARHSSSSLALVPVFGPDRAGAALGGSF